MHIAYILSKSKFSPKHEYFCIFLKQYAFIKYDL